MNKKYWLGGLIAIMMLTSIAIQKTSAQSGPDKFLPILSLQNPVAGDPEAPLEQFVSEPGPGEKRYVSMPVFIKNGLEQTTYTTGNKIVSGEPIYSFQFKIQYNKTHLKFVGLEKRGPANGDTTVLAKDFNLAAKVADDSTYKIQTTNGASLYGSRIMIDGASTLPLPLSRALTNNPPKGNWDLRGWSVLFWAKFEVITDQFGNNITGGLSSGIDRDQIIINKDSIHYGGNIGIRYDPTNITPAMVARGFHPAPASIRPSSNVIFPSIPSVASYPNNYGARIVWIVARPEMDLRPSNLVKSLNGDSTNWELILPIRTWYKNTNIVARQLTLVNLLNGTELTNIDIQSDNNWLRVDTNTTFGAGGSSNPFLERGYQIRKVGLQKIVNIIANPALLANGTGDNPSDYPAPGFYTGYITFKSSDAVNSALRLKVTLVVYRNPLEPNLKYEDESDNQKGIQLLVRNSAPTPDTTYMTFGSGKDATNGLDTLFGEVEALPGDTIMSNKFDARWFPTTNITDRDGSIHPNRGFYDERDDLPDLSYDNSDPYGRTPSTGATPKPTIKHNSIDIRNFKSDTTIVYCAKFSAGAPNFYPISIEYDVNDFPIGSIVYIRDDVNGSLWSTDLRNSTGLGGSKRAFYIRDPNIKGFCIEYTLPKVTQFPEMKNGWNFISMPVRPGDPRSGSVFPNAGSGRPIRFTQAQYFSEDSVAPGIGYFIKYDNDLWKLDQYVSGAKIKEIHELTTPYRVKIFEGWNSVGGLSATASTADIAFGPIGGLATPSRVGEVYRYVTNRGYEQVSLILPGFGYWIKISSSGYFRIKPLPGSFGKEAPALSDEYRLLNKITLIDNSQKSSSLYFGSNKINDTKYELPPLPPTGMFDVRFNNNGFVSSTNNVSGSHTINLQGADFPVVLSVSNSDANYTVVDALTGEVFGEVKQGTNSKVTINNSKSTSLKLVGNGISKVSLGSAFPNPVQRKAMFSISLPNEEYVKIKLNNSIGNEVNTLFEGKVEGTKSVEFSVEGLPSGIYYYTMTTSSGVKEVRQLVVNK
ncbi:MAG: T9SS type A sorting domain-containing protein [Chlorobiota bacterium]|nr:MAG: T9SS type A sorting domain-containing protein [Chlorobiota bacterium]